MSEVEILGYSVVGNRYAIRLTIGEVLELHDGYKDHLIELVDRKHLSAAEVQLAALREELKKERKELGKQRGLKNSMVLHCQDLDQRLADAERRNAALDIESAAKVLANCMDYPWENMPENGRVLMRKHAQHVIDAALNKPEEAKS